MEEASWTRHEQRHGEWPQSVLPDGRRPKTRSVVGRTDWGLGRCASRSARSGSSVGQRFMTMLMALSWRFHDASSVYSYQRGRDASVGGSGPGRAFTL